MREQIELRYRESQYSLRMLNRVLERVRKQLVHYEMLDGYPSMIERHISIANKRRDRDSVVYLRATIAIIIPSPTVKLVRPGYKALYCTRITEDFKMEKWKSGKSRARLIVLLLSVRHSAYFRGLRPSR